MSLQICMMLVSFRNMIVRSRTYPRKGQKQDAQVERGVSDRENNRRFESKWAVLANTRKGAPVGCKVQTTVEDKTDKEGDHPPNGKDYEDEGRSFEAGKDKDASVEEKEGQLREA